jgi:hypothetical protein
MSRLTTPKLVSSLVKLEGKLTLSESGIEETICVCVWVCVCVCVGVGVGVGMVWGLGLELGYLVEQL